MESTLWATRCLKAQRISILANVENFEAKRGNSNREKCFVNELACRARVARKAAFYHVIQITLDVNFFEVKISDKAKSLIFLRNSVDKNPYTRALLLSCTRRDFKLLDAFDRSYRLIASLIRLVSLY